VEEEGDVADDLGVEGGLVSCTARKIQSSSFRDVESPSSAAPIST
jgi:hypothetical protein